MCESCSRSYCGRADKDKIPGQARSVQYSVLAFQSEVTPQETLGFVVHSDCITGDPNSLSDGRLKSFRIELSGQQAQNILKQIKSYTYEREDIGERRLGCIAQEGAPSI